MVLLLAVVAMPVLLKFFAWSSVQVGGAGSGGSAFIGAAGAIALAQSTGRTPAVQRAAEIETNGPGSRMPPAVGPPPPSGAAPSGAYGAGAAATAARGAGAAGAAAAVIAAGAAATKATTAHLTGGGPGDGAAS
jgi:hypothetical protein